MRIHTHDYEREIARRCNMGQKRARRIIDTLFALLVNSLREKGVVSIRSFGRWKVLRAPGGRCGNPPFVRGHCWRRPYAWIRFTLYVTMQRRLRKAGVAYPEKGYQEKGNDKRKRSLIQRSTTPANSPGRTLFKPLSPQAALPAGVHTDGACQP
jgi:hypothetical protein